MRLAALKEARRDDELFQFSEAIVLNLFSFLTEATTRNLIMWQYQGAGSFKAYFLGLELFWDQPNNEPPSLSIFWLRVAKIEDNGSGKYGFDHLRDAINAQYDNRKKEASRL